MTYYSRFSQELSYLNQKSPRNFPFLSTSALKSPVSKHLRHYLCFVGSIPHFGSGDGVANNSHFDFLKFNSTNMSSITCGKARFLSLLQGMKSRT